LRREKYFWSNDLDEIMELINLDQDSFVNMVNSEANQTKIQNSKNIIKSKTGQKEHHNNINKLYIYKDTNILNKRVKIINDLLIEKKS
jgi:hypothetical protein